MVVRDDLAAPWKIIGDVPASQNEDSVDISDEAQPASAGIKRPRSPSAIDSDPPDAKKARSSSGTSITTTLCLAPPPNTTAEKIIFSRSSGDFLLGAGDIFLADGFRERWCHCNSVSSAKYSCC